MYSMRSIMFAGLTCAVAFSQPRTGECRGTVHVVAGDHPKHGASRDIWLDLAGSGERLKWSEEDARALAASRFLS